MCMRRKQFSSQLGAFRSWNTCTIPWQSNENTAEVWLPCYNRLRSRKVESAHGVQSYSLLRSPGLVQKVKARQGASEEQRLQSLRDYEADPDAAHARVQPEREPRLERQAHEPVGHEVGQRADVLPAAPPQSALCVTRCASVSLIHRHGSCNNHPSLSARHSSVNLQQNTSKYSP